jgi:hypothetical protein
LQLSGFVCAISKSQESLHAHHPTPQNPIVLSYFGLRQVVGWIGVLFPFVLALGHFIIMKPLALQPSISDYYYTFMRNIFEGCLCTIGVFLAATWGYDSTDAIAGRIAGFAAIGVAWFPCKHPCTPSWVSHAHVVSRLPVLNPRLLLHLPVPTK